MAEFFETLSDEHRRFIERQHVFFVATATADGRVNLSPKGGPSVVARGPDRLLWLNLTGSGNETAAHVLEQDRITLMWCSFEGPPLILRVYGRARAVHPDEPGWAECAASLPASPGARQYFDIAVESVQTSCGYQVPLMDFREDREALGKWAEKKGEDGLRAYWAEKNAVSIDGRPTRKPE